MFVGYMEHSTSSGAGRWDFLTAKYRHRYSGDEDVEMDGEGSCGELVCGCQGVRVISLFA